MALSRQVLRALEAASDEEYRSLLRQLPVTISDSAGVDQRGTQGYYRNYSVREKTRVSVFRGTRDEYELSAIHGPNQELESSFEGDNDANTEPSFTSPDFSALAALSSEASFEYCELTDPEYGYFDGECATQSEIDDALSAIAVMEADVEAMQAEAAHVDYCLEHPEDYQTCAEQDNSAESFSWEGANLEEGSEEAGAPLMRAYSNSSIPCDVESGLRNATLALGGDEVVGSCADQIANVGWSLLGWAAARYTGVALVTAANPPAAAVFFGVALAAGATYQVASSIANYILCRQS